MSHTSEEVADDVAAPALETEIAIRKATVEAETDVTTMQGETEETRAGTDDLKVQDTVRSHANILADETVPTVKGLGEKTVDGRLNSESASDRVETARSMLSSLSDTSLDLEESSTPGLTSRDMDILTARSALSSFEGKRSDSNLHEEGNRSDTSDLESSTPGLTSSGSNLGVDMRARETLRKTPEKNDRVSATQIPEWNGEYYEGTVDAVNADGTFGVRFDDGDYIGDVRRDELKRFQVSVSIYLWHSLS